MAAGISSIMAQGGMDLARRPVPNLLCLPERGRMGPGGLLIPFQEHSSHFQAAQQPPMLAVISQLAKCSRPFLKSLGAELSLGGCKAG